MLILTVREWWPVAMATAVVAAACGGSAASQNGAPDGSAESASGGPDGASDGIAPDAAGPDGSTPDGSENDSGSIDAVGDATADADGATDSRGPDADGGDFGMPSGNYPAFSPDVGQLAYQSGTVLKQPVIVPITWNMDPSQVTLEKYADGIGQSAYWQTIGKDYGVGAATSGGHVHDASTPPATLTDQDIQSVITSGGMLDGGTASPWPAPTASTIYAFFLAPGTSLLISTFGGGLPTDACQQGIGGYHGAVHSAVLGGDVAYAVVPSCQFGGGRIGEATSAMSHELIEAATDPFAADRSVQNTGWYGFDPNHFDWMYFNELQAEVGDTCEFYQEAFFQNGDTSFPYFLQRIWSNSSIAAGHHPCVPAPPGAYFNVTPLDLTPVSVTIPGLLGGGMPQTMQTKGVRVLAGQSGTFTVGFYSDAPTSGPWTISATPGNPILGTGDSLAQYNQSTITASVDKTSGLNGEKAHVTVYVTSSGTTFNGELLTLTSTLGGVSHYMPIWISGE